MTPLTFSRPQVLALAGYVGRCPHPVEVERVVERIAPPGEMSLDALLVRRLDTEHLVTPSGRVLKVTGEVR